MCAFSVSRFLLAAPCLSKPRRREGAVHRYGGIVGVGTAGHCDIIVPPRLPLLTPDAHARSSCEVNGERGGAAGNVAFCEPASNGRRVPRTLLLRLEARVLNALNLSSAATDKAFSSSGF